MSVEHKNALITFIRVPELGKVKTRLAAELGNHEALRIYRLLLDHTRGVCLGVDASRYLYYATTPTKDSWSEIDFIKKAQHGLDLGERMANAFQDAFVLNDKVVIIGSDCPQLSSSIIEDTFETLDHKNVVIGPTYDGGYFLLGMDSFYPFLFSNVEWSTDKVFAETKKRLIEKDISFEVLNPLGDVDYAKDWNEHGLD